MTPRVQVDNIRLCIMLAFERYASVAMGHVRRRPRTLMHIGWCSLMEPAKSCASDSITMLDMRAKCNAMMKDELSYWVNNTGPYLTFSTGLAV